MDIRRIFGSVPQQDTSQVDAQKSTSQSSPVQSFGLDSVSKNDALEVGAGRTPSVLAKFPPGANVVGLPDIENMPFFSDSETVSGARRTMAMILNYVGLTITPEELDEALSFEATPQTMLEFVQDKGWEAEGYNNGTIAELKSFLEKGIPVMAIIEDESGIGDDYVAVTGFGVDNTKTPPEEYVTYRDGYSEGGIDKRMPLAEFEKRWAAGRPEPVGPGYENYFMAFAPPDTDLPAGRDDGIEAISATATGMTKVWKGFSDLWTGDGSRIHGLISGIGGAVQGAVGALGWALCSGPAQWLHDKVENIPVLENLVQPLTGLWDTAGAVIGDLANAVGALTDNWGQALGSLAEGDFTGFATSFADGLVEAGSAVADAVGDAVGGAVDAVGEFFSGW